MLAVCPVNTLPLLCDCSVFQVHVGMLFISCLSGIFVLETACGESCCPVTVLPPHRDQPPYSHGGPRPGVGIRTRRDRG